MRVTELQAAAAAGDAEAQYLMGLAYLDGRETGRNLEQAVGWLERAAEKNHPKALFALSEVYSDGTVPQDSKRSLAYLKRSAEAGLPDAQHNLGLRYATDRDGRPDMPNAIAWLTKASTAGDPESQFALAEVLENGPGSHRNLAESLAWMRRSADQGFREAQKVMGDRYRRGKGVPEDKVEALKWYLLAGGATKVDAAKSCLRLMSVGREVREESQAAAATLRQSLAPDAIALATRRADEWVVSFTATKVGGCA
jgi:TPR repeat protein